MTTTTSDRIGQLVNNQKLGFSLEQAFYKDPEIYQTELSQIFSKHWLYAGHTSQIPNTGNYVTFEVGTESIIIVRAANGDIKAHINVCRHRGSRICLEPSGKTNMLTCPYHAWSYNLEGQLIAARNMPTDFDRTSNGLHPAKVELIGGFIFICLNEAPLSLASLRSDLNDITELFGLGDMKLAEQKSYSVAANWKLAVENYQECYHCAPSHQEFARVHLMGKPPEVFEKAKNEYWLANQGNPKFKAFNRYFDLAESGQEGYQYDRNPLLSGALSGSSGGKAVAPLLGSLQTYDGGASELMIGPLSFFLIYDDHMLCYRFLPTSVDECVCQVCWFVNQSAVEGEDYNLEQLTWLWDLTTKADKTIITNNQKGLNSRYYQPGRLSEMEAFQQSFLNWYIKALIS